MKDIILVSKEVAKSSRQTKFNKEMLLKEIIKKNWDWVTTGQERLMYGHVGIDNLRETKCFQWKRRE